MTALAARSSLAALLSLVPDQVPDLYTWRDDLAPIVAAGKVGRGERLAALAQRRGLPAKTVRKKFDAFKKHGLAGLIDRRAVPALWESEAPNGLSAADRETLKLWCESFQRNSEAAIRALLQAWRSGRISREHAERGLAVPVTTAPLDPETGYPRGWSARNLLRYAPTAYELKAARIGRSAAASERPLVYTTRANLYVGQFYLWDDLWHDHDVVDLDQRKRGRPLEFHGLDLKSAAKFAWGNRTRVEAEFKHEGLKSSDFRFVLAAALLGTGYHAQRGTTLIVENATAAIPEWLERLLWDASLVDGQPMLRVARGGMEGAAAHAGQYAGRSKGNFRFKAALESLGNLIHNEMAYLPGQVGKDRDHCPEEMHDGGRLVDPATGRALASYGRQKHTDALLAAFSQLPPERAEWLLWDVCTIQQFRGICEEVYARINRRTGHDLEGWDEHYVPDAGNGRMRRLSPHEVFARGQRVLRPIEIETAALIIGSEGGEERMVRSNMIELRDGSVSGDLLRFDATGLLPDREKFLTVLNPFDADRLFCFAANGALAAVLPRLHSVDRGDVEAVQRACGEAAKREAALLQPLRQRHLAEARAKAARHEHNAAVLGHDTPADRAERARLREDAAPINDFLSPDDLRAPTATREDDALTFSEPTHHTPAPAAASDFL